MLDPIIHIVAANPAVVLSDVLSGNHPDAPHVSSLKFIPFTAFLAGDWSGEESAVTVHHTDDFPLFKSYVVNALEKARLSCAIVNRFRYINFTYIDEVKPGETVFEERFEISAYIDQYHSSYRTGGHQEVLEIPEVDEAVMEWDQDYQVL